MSAKDLLGQIVAKSGDPSPVQTDYQGWAKRVVYAYGPKGLLHGIDGSEWGMTASRVEDYSITGYFSPEAPCQMAVGNMRSMAEAELTDHASVKYDDPECTAVLLIELQNQNGFVATAKFGSIDQKRAWDYGKALVETIDRTLGSTTTVARNNSCDGLNPVLAVRAQHLLRRSSNEYCRREMSVSWPGGWPLQQAASEFGRATDVNRFESLCVCKFINIFPEMPLYNKASRCLCR